MPTCAKHLVRDALTKVEFLTSKEFYMKRSKYWDSQIMDALKRVEAGLSVKEIWRERAISCRLSINGERNPVGWMLPCSPL